MHGVYVADHGKTVLDFSNKALRFEDDIQSYVMGVIWWICLLMMWIKFQLWLLFLKYYQS